MNIEITVPEQIKTKEVRSLTILLERDLAIVELWHDQRERVEVDLTSLLKDFDQKVIKDFLKKVISVASGVEIIEIPDKIFKTDVK